MLTVIIETNKNHIKYAKILSPTFKGDSVCCGYK